ncbi:MAG: hypothetical protein JWQ81_1707 [Amycolatopsis sp.]|nr:hypothetical protein [Amycolatopsis sp.]
MPGAIGGVARRVGLRHRTLFAVAGGVLAVVPALVAGSGAANWVNVASTVYVGDVPLTGGYNPGVQQIAVDGSLPNAPIPLPLPAYELPNGPLGIPVTAFAAYKNAAAIMATEQVKCHIDWALIASIGRIESNHARGGYVDAKGTTLEPILGPVLDGSGPFAAIPDTDQGRYDGDKVWDRAVGPSQFLPATWLEYASDGNGDGVSDPNNVFDASLATGRYLCSGGLDLANPDQLKAAIYRYNNSDTYVNTVLLWAQAYRSGVLQTPDSKVPVGAPNGAVVAAGPPAVPPPVPPVTATMPPPATWLPPTTSKTSSSSSTTSPTTTPTCVTSTTTPTPTTPLTTTPPPTTTPTTTPPTTTTTTPLPICGQPTASVTPPPVDSSNPSATTTS